MSYEGGLFNEWGELLCGLEEGWKSPPKRIHGSHGDTLPRI